MANTRRQDNGSRHGLRKAREPDASSLAPHAEISLADIRDLTYEEVRLAAQDLRMSHCEPLSDLTTAAQDELYRRLHAQPRHDRRMEGIRIGTDASQAQPPLWEHVEPTKLDKEALNRDLGIRSLSEVTAVRPLPMMLDRLDPEGHTILFGAGGSGKGSLVSWWIVQLVRAGRRVLILDYENHPGEWARRVDSLGGADVRDNVIHAAPLTAAWTRDRGPIWRQAPLIRALAEANGCDVIVVDSIVIGCAGFDPMKPETPALYASGLELIGLPALSLAHVTKTEDLRYPFGSAFWHNLARTTWSLKRHGERAILTHRKRNNYSSLGRLVVTMTWHDDELREVREQPFSVVLADRIDEALDDDSLTLPQIVDRLNEDATDDADPVKANSVRQALLRGTREPQRFTVDGSGSGARYRRVAP